VKGGPLPQTFLGKKCYFSVFFPDNCKNSTQGTPKIWGAGSPPLGVATPVKFFSGILDPGWLDNVNHTVLGWTL